MKPTPEMIEVAAKAIAFAGRGRNDVSEDAVEFWTYTDDVGKARYLKMATAALALLPGEPRPIDRQRATDAAVKANHAYGQWMPEHWLHLFLDAYEGTL